jgi:outer membrane lipopolysaccharide assembly protein LptE/RlpB
MILKFLPRILLPLLLFLGGCGYTQKTVLPGNIKTIYVDTVTNKIPVNEIYAYVPRLEIEITNAIIRQLNRDGTLKVVPREEADAVLKASMIGFLQEGVRFTSLESVEEYQMFVILNMTLQDNKNKRVIWEEPNFSGDAYYFVSQFPSLSRDEAAQRAIDRLAENVVDRIVEDW